MIMDLIQSTHFRSCINWSSPDGNQITSILLGQTKGRRTLLAYDFEISDDDSPSFLGNESFLDDKLQNSLES